MSLVCVTCNCGSSDKLIRRKLKLSGYADWLRIPVHKGKDASLSALGVVPQTLEVSALRAYITSHSRFAVVLGVSGDTTRWADIASPSPKESIEAELIIKHFGV